MVTEGVNTMDKDPPKSEKIAVDGVDPENEKDADASFVVPLT